MTTLLEDIVFTCARTGIGMTMKCYLSSVAMRVGLQKTLYIHSRVLTKKLMRKTPHGGDTIMSSRERRNKNERSATFHFISVSYIGYVRSDRHGGR